MKLISFAALSFLAITVSAYPGLDTPSQGAEQSQSLQPSQDEIQAEMERLETIRKTKKGVFILTQNKLNKVQQEVIPLGRKMDNTKAKMQKPGLSSEEKSELEKQYNEAEAAFADFTVRCKKQNQLYADAMSASDDASARERLLEDNQKLLEKYNAEHEVQMGTSSNSFYNLPILKTQYDEILQKIKNSPDENARKRLLDLKLLIIW
ncbi:hypothetical protein BASA50_002065 [Batrachochytrium salamandrivorans]|uniref:Uncharacterized protein n=1 Tax=Batrachochytrium salamandrivorans TaxID=1357716 RepID=A0ABQ8FMA1_9FUNG|nr:hypothetical protein BASA50_002065 [Batrachochytrium salamandrivorans]